MPRSIANLLKPHPTIRRGNARTKRLAGAIGPLAGPECTKPNPKETAMFRTFTTAAILALTVTAAQAGDTVTVHVGDLNLTRAQDTQTLATRVQAAAKTACTQELGVHTQAIAHNNAVLQSCVKQASKSAMTKYQALAKAKAVENKLAGN